MSKFKLKSTYVPTGDQPQAIEFLTNGVMAGMEHQTLLGVTGSGKTFTVANVIQNIDKPVLVISHNKTLAAQLYQEYKEFFPENAVEYFVSYYDYYQPEAYLPQTDTYIEKDADINEDIDKLRLSTSTSLMTRSDVIVVASVSCIYNLGNPVEYKNTTLPLKVGMPLRQQDLFTRLIQLFYNRSDFEFKRGTFRANGDIVDIYPAYLDFAIRIETFNDILKSMRFIEPVSGKLLKQEHFLKERKGSYYKNISQNEMERMVDLMAYGEIVIFPAKHYVTNEDRRTKAIAQITADLASRCAELEKAGKVIEAYRLKQKTEYDLEMLREIGYCKGIENYSRYFDGRSPGDPAYSLLDFFPKDYLTIIDESHITVSQIQGMYNGDKARKQTLIDYGFRLPSALDNRPLQFDEFLDRTNQVIYTSATPREWEVKQSINAYKHVREKVTDDDSFIYPKAGIVEQLIRPTGLIDPEIQVRGSKDQIDNLVHEIQVTVKNGQRVLVTTLTKRMAEDLSEYLREQGIAVQYLHSDVDTLDRIDVLNDLREGKYDVVVGINLLREGLDLPEVSLVAILDADKEGFLRSDTSLVQTMGRAARHVEGRVIMYADSVTGSMQRAIDEVNRRRKIQLEYNEKQGITPLSIIKPLRDRIIERTDADKPKNYDRIKLEIEEFEDEILGINGDLGKDDHVGYNEAEETDLTGKSNAGQAKGRAEVIKKLKLEMNRAAKELDFERAAAIRDRIRELSIYKWRPPLEFTSK